MATSAERQAVYRKKMREAGMVPVSVYVPEGQRAQLMMLALALVNDPNLEIGPVRDVRTGRLRSV